MDTNIPWIAIVDDDAAIRRALLRLMRAAGLAARAFASGPALLAAVADGTPPSCAILDLHMPEMDGFALRRRLAEAAPATGVVLMTGHHSLQLEAAAGELELLAFLRKPVDGNELLAAIRTGMTP